MKRMSLFFFVGILVLFIQTSLFAGIFPASIRPDLFVFLVVYLSLTQTTGRGGLIAWMLGLLKDSFAGVTFGLHGFAFVVTFLLARMVVRKLNPESPVLLVLLASCAMVVENGVVAMSLLTLAEAGDGWRIVLRQIPAQVVVTTLMACLLLPFMRWGSRRAASTDGTGLS